MKKRKKCVALGIIAIFLMMWFSKCLPKQVVKLVAINYMAQQEDGAKFILKEVDYSSAHNAYFAYFDNQEDMDGETRNIGIYYKWFPFYVYFDSQKPQA